MTPEVPSPSGGRAAFAFIFVTLVLDSLALGVIIPVLPALIAEFQGGDAAATATIYGVFGSAWAAMQFVFSPVLGSLSDRFGRRPVILLSNLGLGLDYALMALAPSIGWLFLGRLISGITSSTYGAANAYIADVTPPEQRAAKFGLLGVAFGVGFVLGPSVGGLLSVVGVRAPFWAAAALSVANFLYGWFILPESLATDRRSRFHWSRANPLGSLRLLRSHPLLLGLALASFLSMLAHDSLPSTYVLYTTYRYGWSEATIGLVLALVGFASIVVQGGLVGRLVAALGERRALMLGFACGALGMFVYGAAPTGALFLLGLPMTAFFGLATPALQSLMTGTVAVSEQGQLQGANGSLMGVASMLAPLIFTQVFAAAVNDGSSPAAAGAPFLLAGGLLITALVVAERVLSRRPIPAPPPLSEGP
jgi:DHA1 family tetracycline resistance protein-like MFS transporter